MNPYLMNEVSDAYRSWCIEKGRKPEIVIFSNRAEVLQIVPHGWLASGWYMGALCSCEKLPDGVDFYIG